MIKSQIVKINYVDCFEMGLSFSCYLRKSLNIHNYDIFLDLFCCQTIFKISPACQNRTGVRKIKMHFLMEKINFLHDLWYLQLFYPTFVKFMSGGPRYTIIRDYKMPSHYTCFTMM